MKLEGRFTGTVFVMVLSIAIAYLVSCGGGHPQAVNVAGNWSGTLLDNGVQGQASLNLIEDADGKVTGTFSFTDLGSNCDGSDVSVTGKVSGMQISLSNNSIAPTNIKTTVDASLKNMSGSESSRSGVCGSTGTVSLTKQ